MNELLTHPHVLDKPPPDLRKCQLGKPQLDVSLVTSRCRLCSLDVMFHVCVGVHHGRSEKWRCDQGDNGGRLYSLVQYIYLQMFAAILAH